MFADVFASCVYVRLFVEPCQALKFTLDVENTGYIIGSPLCSINYKKQACVQQPINSVLQPGGGGVVEHEVLTKKASSDRWSVQDKVQKGQFNWQTSTPPFQTTFLCLTTTPPPAGGLLPGGDEEGGKPLWGRKSTHIHTYQIHTHMHVSGIHIRTHTYEKVASSCEAQQSGEHQDTGGGVRDAATCNRARPLRSGRRRPDVSGLTPPPSLPDPSSNLRPPPALLPCVRHAQIPMRGRQWRSGTSTAVFDWEKSFPRTIRRKGGGNLNDLAECSGGKNWSTTNILKTSHCLSSQTLQKYVFFCFKSPLEPRRSFPRGGHE